MNWGRESLETGPWAVKQSGLLTPASDLAGLEGGPAFSSKDASLAKRDSWHRRQGKVPVARRAEGVGQARANNRPLDAVPLLASSPFANINRGKTQHVGKP